MIMRALIIKKIEEICQRELVVELVRFADRELRPGSELKILI